MAWTDGLKKNFGVSSARRFIEEKLCYPMEKHVYTTEDGHINTIYRIPGKVYTRPKLHQKDPSRPVVLYQHGLNDCFAGIVADGE